jgi:hypothetical protein
VVATKWKGGTRHEKCYNCRNVYQINNGMGENSLRPTVLVTEKLLMIVNVENPGLYVNMQKKNKILVCWSEALSM